MIAVAAVALGAALGRGILAAFTLQNFLYAITGPPIALCGLIGVGGAAIVFIRHLLRN